MRIPVPSVGDVIDSVEGAGSATDYRNAAEEFRFLAEQLDLLADEIEDDEEDEEMTKGDSQ